MLHVAGELLDIIGKREIWEPGIIWRRLQSCLNPRDADGHEIDMVSRADEFVESQKQPIDLSQAGAAPFSRLIRENQDPAANSICSGYHSRPSMISIIIPTLEEEKMIGPTLSLLKSQLTIPHEIIVSDGGSKDQTVEIAKKFADKVIVYEKQSRQTIAQGRNDGARVAEGDFLVFTDADCVIPEPDAFFTSAISRFQSEPRLVALTSHFRFFPEAETFGDRVVLWTRDFAVGLQNNVFRNGDCAGGEFQMVRKDAFVAIEGYREELVTLEDRDLFIRLAKIGRTMSDRNLVVFHSGRRAHTVGWPRLIGMFCVNMISFYLRGRLLSKEWKPVR